MFAYCGNSPISFFDHTGERMVGALDIEYEGKQHYIYNQNEASVGSLKLGSATVSHGGCGPVACYNAMQIMGKSHVTFQSVLKYYEAHNGYLLGGYLGTSIYTCISYFEDNGFTVVSTKDISGSAEYAQYADACILWCWFDTNAFPYLGAHFMAFEQSDGKGTYYNAYKNSVEAYSYTGDCYDFLGHYSGSNAVLIMIFDN